MNKTEELWLEGGGMREVYTDDYVDSLLDALATVTKELDELVAAATALIESVRITDRDVAWDGLKAAIAKVGAENAGEKNE